ncbi:MAG: response regulator transcription factor [Candidatus Marinimicrobia bacterium]|nr:response regulator transcription factor [Candidatus Neomarinimicrobiota bacterium]
MIKVLIADDHALFREGLKMIIGRHSDIEVSGEASNGQEALEKVWNEEFDVVLLDISMPGRSGIDILKEIKSAKHDFNVLMLSMHPEELYAVRALKAGASGYLTKESAPDELIDAIRRVSMGLKYVTLSLAEKLATELEVDRDKPLHEQLSDREFEVMQMIAKGHTIKEIAERFFLSSNTISTYKSRIFEKMNMKSNADIISYLMEHNLTDSL